MNIIDEGINDFSWELVEINSKEKRSNLSNSSRVKVCTCCGYKMLLVNDEIEMKIIDKLNNKSPLRIPFGFIASTKSAAINKLNKYADSELPISCEYYVEGYRSYRKYRLSGYFEYKIGKKFIGLTPALKGVCPCCKKKYDEATEENISQLCDRDYSKLIKKYKSKVKKECVDIDYSSFDFKEYLGTLIELYKDSFILEKQIKSFLAKKYACDNAVLKAKGLYYLEKKNDNSREYTSAVKQLEKLQDALSKGVQLSPVQKKSAWEEFIQMNPEWSVFITELERPEKPVAPNKPKKPTKPIPFEFDESRLVKPIEPVYGEGNFFTKKKIEKQNEELRKKYEQALKKYSEACDEYERLQIEQERKESEYVSAVNDYEEQIRRYEESMTQFALVMAEYERKLQSFEEAENKRNELSLREKETKDSVYENALQNKKASMIEEIERLQTFIDDFEVCQRKNREQEASTLPSVVSGITAGMIIEDEITGMIEDLFDIYGAIDELQSLNVIFEKYNQFHILCIFYEYFLSGRVTELVGPHGAYNLYEGELRSDKILRKLDAIDEKLETIIGHLDDIKESQVVLYKTMKEINTGINKMCKSMDDLTDAIETSMYSISKIGENSVPSIGMSSTPSISSHRSSVASLPSYSSYTSLMSTQRSSFSGTVQRASVVKRGILGGIIAGPAGAIVGALSAIDKNRR